MNTWGYLILITALLVLAGLMLYARFATRSREKSLHHAPSDWIFMAGMPVLPSSEIGSEDPAGQAQVRIDRLPVEYGTAPAPTTTRDYLDELQEAAAGLAKLMRSSPAARPDPVIFSPERLSDPIDPSDAVGGETLPEREAPGGVPGIAEAESPPAPQPVAHHDPAVSKPEENRVAASEIPGSGPGFPGISEEAVFVSMESVVCEPSLPVEGAIDDGDLATGVPARPMPGLRELLGETVTDHFDRIDAGLDALEILVANIEESLLLLSDYERVGDEVSPAGEEGSRVAEAA